MPEEICDICGGELDSQGKCPACEHVLNLELDDTLEKDIEETVADVSEELDAIMAAFKEDSLLDEESLEAETGLGSLEDEMLEAVEDTTSPVEDAEEEDIPESETVVETPEDIVEEAFDPESEYGELPEDGIVGVDDLVEDESPGNGTEDETEAESAGGPEIPDDTAPGEDVSDDAQDGGHEEGSEGAEGDGEKGLVKEAVDMVSDTIEDTIEGVEQGLEEIVTDDEPHAAKAGNDVANDGKRSGKGLGTALLLVGIILLIPFIYLVMAGSNLGLGVAVALMGVALAVAGVFFLVRGRGGK